jgi:hypothetical protein
MNIATPNVEGSCMSYVKSEVYLIDRAFLNFVPRGLHARNNFKTHDQRLSPQFLTHIQAFPS